MKSLSPLRPLLIASLATACFATSSPAQTAPAPSYPVTTAAPAGAPAPVEAGTCKKKKHHHKKKDADAAPATPAASS